MTTPRFHIVITRDTLFVVRDDGSDWRVFQDRYSGFMTSLGPMPGDGVLDTFENEWPDLLVINNSAIKDYVGPDNAADRPDGDLLITTDNGISR